MKFAAVEDVALHARYVLLDVTEPRRFSDELFWTAAYYGLHEMERLRPDLFLEWSPPASSVDGATALTQLDPQYRPALADYICYWIETQDAESTDENRAAMHYSMFTKKMVGAGA